jgi:hypothetical protein
MKIFFCFLNKDCGEPTTENLRSCDWWNILEKVRTFYQENPDAD